MRTYSETKYEVLRPKKHQTAVQEGMVEMSQKKQNLILIRFQIRKKYQCPLRRTAVRFSDTLLE